MLIRYNITNDDEAERCTFLPTGSIGNYQQADRHCLSIGNMLTKAFQSIKYANKKGASNSIA